MGIKNALKKLSAAFLAINNPVAMPCCSSIFELWDNFLQAVLLFLCISL